MHKSKVYFAIFYSSCTIKETITSVVYTRKEHSLTFLPKVARLESSHSEYRLAWKVIMAGNSGDSMSQKNQLRVMIADDIMETRRSTRLMLTLIPEAKLVAVAQNGVEAVEISRKQKLDIALMDVSMPEMDGVTAIKEMLKYQPGIGCIVISAERDSEILRRAMSAGAKGYLIKPTTTEEFVETFRRVAKLVETGQIKQQEQHQRHERKIYLQQMAMQFVKSRRTDDQALAVFEELASNPNCEVPWLQSLAVIYVFRQEWDKLSRLADRLNKLALSQ